ncbi:hypothetical protein [Nocardia sp. NPDC050710]|uniref:hypothetical protein n=1 Tax=Nocardia sp. NPDC050710 TaxID=3157220 RepID=UPI0033EC7A51
MNLRLVGPDQAEAAARLEEFANSYGGSVADRVYYERGSAVGALWSLIQTVDNDLGGQVLPRLHAVAQHNAMSVDQLVRSPLPTPALWWLLDELSNAGGGHLLVPSPAHFDQLGVPRHILLHRISELTPMVHVVFTDPEPGSSEPGLVAEVVVPAFHLAEEIIGVNLRQRLPRAGLGDVVEPIMALVHELISASLDKPAAELATEHNSIRVRVLCPPGSSTVAVEFYESRDGGSVTRHEIPLPAEQHEDPPDATAPDAGHTELADAQPEPGAVRFSPSESPR